MGRVYDEKPGKDHLRVWGGMGVWDFVICVFIEFICRVHYQTTTQPHYRTINFPQ
jgi:hypothetical protein